MLIGSVLGGRYRIQREIGKGGMGSVCEAVHLATDRAVAVKVMHNLALRRGPEALERFQREARVAGRIESQHIGQVLDAGVDEATGVAFLVMELLNGEDLQQLVARLGPLQPELALRVVAQACVGLAKAHETGVIHRDIKPANIFLAQRDRGEVVVKILDFGVAKVRADADPSADPRSGLTGTGMVLGSPRYMSPEHAKGLATMDQRADLWSLGIALYEALAGRTPYHHIDTIGQLILAICTEVPPPVQETAPWVPPAVAGVVHRALQTDPGDRFQSAADMLAAVTALLPGRDDTIRVDMLRGVSPPERAQVAPRFMAAAGASARPGVVSSLAKADTVAVPPSSTATVMLEAPASAGGGTSSLPAPSDTTFLPPASTPVVGSTPAPSTSGAVDPPRAEPVPARPSRGIFGAAAAFVAVVALGSAVVAFTRTPTPAPAAGSAKPVGSAPTAQPTATPAPVAVPSATASASAAAPGGDDIVTKLAELRRRFEAGKMTRAAYEAERKRMLDGM